jgi:hypothetical protein
MNRNYLLLAVSLLYCFSSTAQNFGRPDHDTTYYKSYKGTIICRMYFSRNYMQLNLQPPDDLTKMSYHANTPLNIGAGFTYRSFSVSFSKGLNFLRSNSTKGTTQYTDLQVHLYKRKWTIDGLAQFYKGFYLNPRGLAYPDGREYYVRPDMGVKLVGTSIYRVLNDRKFSYGAGLSQNAWQQKSAGSFLIGGEAFYVDEHADSAFAPHVIDSSYNQQNIHKVHIFEIGPGIGYAYTLVWNKHWFLLGSFNANINFRFSRELGNSIRDDRVGFTPNFILRVATGYNSNKWGLGLLWIATNINTDRQSSGYNYKINTGGYRLIYARRFAINHKMKTILGPDQ